VRQDTGQTVAAYDLGGFQVTEPARGDGALEEGMAVAGETAVSANLRLLGTRLDRQEAAPGDVARVTSLWQVVESAAEAATDQFNLQLLAPDGGLRLNQAVTIAPEYPLAQWQPGDRLRSETILRLPADLPAGRYTWRLQWGDREVNAGEIQVNAPERSFVAPEMETAVNTPFGDVATLLGVSVTPASTLRVTLAWRAERETPVSYRVFVHLIDEAGQIITQSDGEPAHWGRPTTGWLTGEVVLDEHELVLPATLPDGPLSLRVGLYDPETGERLPAATGEFLIIPLDAWD